MSSNCSQFFPTELKMADQTLLCDNCALDLFREIKHEEDEEEFSSCFEDDDVWRDTEETVDEKLNKCTLDEFSVKLFFKGSSLIETGESTTGVSGIGVVMERATGFPAIQVQKKLDFYVEESVADYLALMDGIVEAVAKNIHHVYAFTDSEVLRDQLKHEEKLKTPLLVAMRERVLEHVSNLDTFVIDVIPSAQMEGALNLARVAIGVVSCPTKWDRSCENCSICCENKPSPMMIKMKCSHKFCSQCMKTYIDEKIISLQVPIQCPHWKCKHYVSKPECKTFLPFDSYKCLEEVLAEVNDDFEKIYCPFSNCSVMLDPQECLSARASSSSQSESTCIECPVCQRFICFECGVPWHSSMNCEEYQNLPLDERKVADITLHRLAQNNRWRRCQQCSRMIELTQGCDHMTCRCGLEFCYSCGAEYRDGIQTCQCFFLDNDEEEGEDSIEESVSQSAQASEQWAWESFNMLPTLTDAYTEQERSQLALIQRFLAGGFSLSDHPAYQYQSPPRCADSYGDAIKDLHQLPWLERFVSVISDDYYEDYMQ